MPSIGSLAMIAEAWVDFTLWAYFGLARKVNCPGPACSMPDSERISMVGSPATLHPSWAAISASEKLTGVTVPMVTVSIVEQSGCQTGGYPRQLAAQASEQRKASVPFTLGEDCTGA